MIVAKDKLENEAKEDHFRFRLRRDTVRAVRPPTNERTWDIISSDIRSHKNEPFSANDYPWTEGICDSWDEPQIRIVVLQFAARIGKTLLAQALIISGCWKSPATAMFASSTEQLVKETIKHKYYPMFEKCRRTRKWVPPVSRRLQTRMDLSQMTMYTAWGGSYSTLADKDPRYKHGGEIDKWDKSTSTEADSLELFMERGIEIPDRKSVLESTPGTEGISRVNRYLNLGWNCRFHCPCPFCGHFQELVLGDGSGGGIVFEKKDGKLDGDLAFRTAKYRCEKCEKLIPEHKRRSMIRKGKWCAEGQYIDKRGRTRGKKLHDGEIASFQLSRIYAPTFTFGDIARKFVECKHALDKGSDEQMRNFYNSWLGLTWTPRRLVTTWEILGPRLSNSCEPTRFEEYHLGTIPGCGNFATMGVDVQADHYVYAKIAWNHKQSGFLYDYGICHNEADLFAKILEPGQMQRGEEVINLCPRLTLIDARDGNRQDEVIDLCRKMNAPSLSRWVWPSMGTKSSIMKGKTFDRHDVDGTKGLKNQKRKKLKPQFYWISVNTGVWQQWIQNCLVKRFPGEPYSLALPIEAREDRDFLEQLLNVQPETKRDTTGHSCTEWVVLHEHIPKDFRDAVRYARCGAEVHQVGNWNRIMPETVMNTQRPTKEESIQPSRKPKTNSRIKKVSNWIKKRKGKFIGK